MEKNLLFLHKQIILYRDGEGIPKTCEIQFLIRLNMGRLMCKYMRVDDSNREDQTRPHHFPLPCLYRMDNNWFQIPKQSPFKTRIYKPKSKIEIIEEKEKYHSITDNQREYKDKYLIEKGFQSKFAGLNGILIPLFYKNLTFDPLFLKPDFLSSYFNPWDFFSSPPFLWRGRIDNNKIDSMSLTNIHIIYFVFKIRIKYY